MKESDEIYTVAEYIGNKVKFGVTTDTLKAIFADRGKTLEDAYADCERDELRLLYADVLRWIVLGPSKVNNTSDTDNGWTHAGGGYELTDEDRSELKAEANAIYAELEPNSVMKKRSTFRVVSHGIKRANVGPDGRLMPRIVK